MEASSAPQPTTIVAIGNPGAGKSTLGNLLAGSVMFDARVSEDGAGITKEASEKTVSPTYSFVDTPGIAETDPQTRERACEELGKRLKKNQNVKMVFFVGMTSGRIMAQDLETMALTLRAVRTDLKPQRYGVVVNKVKPVTFASWVKEPKNRAKIVASLKAAMPHDCETDCVFFNAFDPNLEDANNVEVPPNPDFENFIKSVPELSIVAENVKGIETDEAKRKKLMAEVAKAQADNLANEARVIQIQKDWEEKFRRQEMKAQQERERARAELRRREKEAEQRQLRAQQQQQKAEEAMRRQQLEHQKAQEELRQSQIEQQKAQEAKQQQHLKLEREREQKRQVAEQKRQVAENLKRERKRADEAAAREQQRAKSAAEELQRQRKAAEEAAAREQQQKQAARKLEREREQEKNKKGAESRERCRPVSQDGECSVLGLARLNCDNSKKRCPKCKYIYCSYHFREAPWWSTTGGHVCE